MKLPRRIFKKPLEEELGFGKQIATQTRMMNPDGSFNIIRQSLNFWDNAYYNLISMPLPFFMGLVFSLYVLVNLLFAFLYMAIGIEQIHGVHSGYWVDDLCSSFFFSTQTLTTVGYGAMSPKGFAANALAAFESFSGLLSFALISGLLYGRFSRPKSGIVFSENMLVSPYQDGTGLMYRMGNTLRSEMIETEVQVLLAINQKDESEHVTRKFYPLNLEVNKISFFSLSWTVVHAIDATSPLYDFTAQDLIDAHAEFLVLVKGIDEANQQQVHSRRSYIAEELVWDARFKPVIQRRKDELPILLTRQIGDFEMIT